MAFDPAQFGAIPVSTVQNAQPAQGQTTQPTQTGMSSSPQPGVFNPASFGAIPVQQTTPIQPANNVQGQTPLQPQEPGVFKRIGTGVGNILKGAAKGLGHTISSSTQLAEQGLNQTAGRVGNAIATSGKNFSAPQPSQAQQNIISKVNQALQPTTLGQKVGFGAEQVAEFLAPGGAEADAVDAADKGAEALDLSEKATNAIKIGTRTVTSAATNAAVTAAQGGSKSDVATSGILGGVFGAVSKPVEDLIQKLPENLWSGILNRTMAKVAKNPDLPEQAAGTGLVGSAESLSKQAGQAIQKLEVNLDSVLSGANGKIDGPTVAHYLDTLKNTYANVPGESHSVSVIANLQQELADKGEMSALDANQLKRDIYGIVAKSYGKGTLEVPAKTEAQKIAASGIKQEIEKIAPEAKNINAQQGIYIQMKNAIDRQLNMGEGKGAGKTGLGLYKLLTGGIGATVGALSSPDKSITGRLAGAGAGAVVGAGAEGIAESAGMRSGLAKTVDYFNDLSPTQKLLFYNGLKGLTTKAAVGLKNAISSNNN